MRSGYPGSLLGISDLDEDQSPPHSTVGTHWGLQLAAILTGVLLLVATVFGKDLGWFRPVVAFFAVFVFLSAIWTLRGPVITRWDTYRARTKQAAAARRLYPDFLDILKRLRRYTNTDSSHADTVPYFLWALSNRNELNLRLPLDTAGAQYPKQFYDHLCLRTKDTPPRLAEFRELLGGLGDILELYHRMYVLWPYEELRRSPNVAQILGYERDNLVVQVDEYNAFLRDVKAFGRRINEVLEDESESFFPTYLEMLKPLP